MSVASQEPREIPSLWRPLHVPTFRNLLVAEVASDVGTFMQSVGAAWMMVHSIAKSKNKYTAAFAVSPECDISSARQQKNRDGVTRT